MFQKLNNYVIVFMDFATNQICQKVNCFIVLNLRGLFVNNTNTNKNILEELEIAGQLRNSGYISLEYTANNNRFNERLDMS